MTDNTTDIAKEADPAEAIEQPVIDDTIISPGSLSRGLKKCREEADMDIKQAADEMRLPLAVLKALEAENFTDLPEPPYIRGYLRSYSRLNDSDPNVLIRRYEVLRGADPDDVASFTPSMPLNRVANKPTVSPGTVKLAGLALIVLLLGVLSMIPAVSQWATDTWQSFSQKTAEQQAGGEIQPTRQATGTEAASESDAANNISTGDATNSASSTNDTAANSGDSEQLALNNQDSENSEAAASDNASDDNAVEATTDDDKKTEDDNPEKAPESAETDNTETAQADQENKQADNDAAKATQEAEAAAAKKAEEEAAAAKLAEEKKAEEEAAAAKLKLAEEKKAKEEAAAAKLAKEKKAEEEAKKLAAAEAAKQNQQGGDNFKQPIDGNVMIRLDFSESVWMSIKDGKGKSIFSALNAPGTRKELKARTPLVFKVGNAPGVKIYLNGQLIDQAPYSQGSVAKFSVN